MANKYTVTVELNTNLEIEQTHNVWVKDYISCKIVEGFHCHSLEQALDFAGVAFTKWNSEELLVNES